MGNLTEKLNARQWKSAGPPRRLLIIRLQAIGDVVLTYPLVQALKNEYPGMEIDFVTRHIQGSLTSNLTAVHKVIAITNSQRTWRQLWDLAANFPYFFRRKYDVIIDLQRNRASRMLCGWLRPSAWAEFDRKGLSPAILRYRQAVEATGLTINSHYPVTGLSKPGMGNQLLMENGWDGQSALVVLNPAGLFSSRNWPIENYVAFARQWKSRFAQTQFLVLGDARIAQKAQFLKEQLGSSLVTLHQKTSLEEAFCILAKVQFMLSEDSGLFWMAWVQKVPSLAMFGSTPGARMRMGGSHARFLTSSDLPCGDCLLPLCTFGKTAKCLARYSPESLVTQAWEILGIGAAQTNLAS